MAWSVLALALIGCGGGDGKNTECDDACPEGTNLVRVDFEGTIRDDLVVVEGKSCLAFCEPAFRCDFPNVPVVDDDVFTCNPLEGYATVTPSADVDTSFGTLWVEADPPWELAVPVFIHMSDVGDIDGDGREDLVLGGEGLSVSYGRADGTLDPPVDLGLAIYSERSLALGDMDGDGLVDLATTSGGVLDPAYALEVRYGDGAGGFGAPTHVADVQGGLAAAVDFDGDGRDDLLLDGESPAILFPDPGGGFVQRTLPGGPWGAQQADVYPADVNGDGLLDVLTGNGGGSVWTQSSARSIGSPTTGANGTQEITVVGALDVDADGDDEMIQFEGGGATQLTVWDWNGAFTAMDPIGGTSNAFGIRRRDMDDDGTDDVPLGNPGFLMSNNGNPWLATRQGPGGKAAAADIDGDGLFELVVAEGRTIGVVYP